MATNNPKDNTQKSDDKNRQGSGQQSQGGKEGQAGQQGGQGGQGGQQGQR